MELLTPGTGLLFWQFIVFVGLFILLGKMAWKPILASLKERETSIQAALDAAEKAKAEMASLKEDNEKLLKETRAERDVILREAREAANRLHARAVINTEKQAALRDVRAQVAAFSIEIAEKLIKKNLATDASQKALVDTFIKDLKLN